MGAEQSTLKKNGYVLQRTTQNAVVATKGDETFLIKKASINADPALASEIKTFKTMSHPHIVSGKNSFKDGDTYYIVMDYCQGGSLATKIKEMSDSPQELEVLSWISEICVALKTIHEKGLLHKHLTPENVLLTEVGVVCLGEFGEIHENSKNTQLQSTNQTVKQSTASSINYLAPEVFTEGTYDAKSDIWSVGCILYELCTQQRAFPEETTIKLMPKIIGGPYPSLPEPFSSELWGILDDIFNKDRQLRPTASDILHRPVIIRCLSRKCTTTVEDLQTKLASLRVMADGLERVHQGTTIGSLTGGVIGAVGGITSIVGLILAPFTLGASLIVTGVGVGVSVAGGVTAGASNITNMVNESSDRKAVQSIIKEFEQKINAVVTWLQEISFSLQTIRSRCDKAGMTEREFNEENFARLGFRAGRGLGGIAELVRLVQVVNIGKIAAQAARAVRVAEVASGVFAGLFVAVDLFFIAMDAKEIHHIRQARSAEAAAAATTCPESETETETDDPVPTSDQAALLSSSLMQEVQIDTAEQELESDSSEAQGEPSQNTAPIRSEIMKFVRSIRQAADELEKVLDELMMMISSIPLLEDESE